MNYYASGALCTQNIIFLYSRISKTSLLETLANLGQNSFFVFKTYI
jgi:hypothetical protein